MLKKAAPPKQLKYDSNWPEAFLKWYPKTLSGLQYSECPACLDTLLLRTACSTQIHSCVLISWNWALLCIWGFSVPWNALSLIDAFKNLKLDSHWKFLHCIPSSCAASRHWYISPGLHHTHMDSVFLFMSLSKNKSLHQSETEKGSEYSWNQDSSLTVWGMGSYFVPLALRMWHFMYTLYRRGFPLSRMSLSLAFILTLTLKYDVSHWWLKFPLSTVST